jgi:hypothetical protein
MTVGSGCIKKIGQLELKLTGQILDNDNRTVGSGCIKKIGQLELKLTRQILDNDNRTIT